MLNFSRIVYFHYHQYNQICFSIHFFSLIINSYNKISSFKAIINWVILYLIGNFDLQMVLPSIIYQITKSLVADPAT